MEVLITEITIFHDDTSPIGEFDVAGIDNDGINHVYFNHIPLLSRTIRIYRNENVYRINFFEHGSAGDVERDTFMNSTRDDVIHWLHLCEYPFNVSNFYILNEHIIITNGFGEQMTLSTI
jgi:hypothetical protein